MTAVRRGKEIKQNELQDVYKRQVNVWENIVLPLGLDGRKVDEAYVNDIIATLGVENRIYNLPNQLSGRCV